MVQRNALFSSPLGSFVGAATTGTALLVLCGLALTQADPGGYFAVKAGTAAYVAAALVIALHLTRSYTHAILGWCNIVTLGRLVIVGVLLIALLAGLAPSWVTFGLAAGALALDGIDGWLARKQRLASSFGARFDVEVDAAFALVLAVFAALNGAAGGYVILLGIPYYMFGFAKHFAPWLDQPLPESFSRKAVCVFQIAALIALQVPFLADGRIELVAGAVTMALMWSFGRDILWLWKNAQ